MPARIAFAGLSQWSVAARIRALLALMAVGLGLLAATGMWAKSRMAESLVDADEVQVPAIRSTALVEVACEQGRGLVEQAIVAASREDEDAIDDADAGLQQADKRLSRALASLESLPLAAEVDQALATFTPLASAHMSGARAIIDLCSDEKLDQAKAAVSRFEENFEALRAAMDSLSQLVELHAHTSAAIAASTSELTSRALIGVALGIGLLAIGFGLLLARSIVRPLRAALDTMMSGDVSKLADIQGKDEFGQMAQAVVRTITTMQRNADELREKTRQIEEVVADLEHKNREVCEQTVALTEKNRAIEENAALVAAQKRAVEQSAAAAKEMAERATASAAEAAKVASMVESSSAGMLYVDEDLRITYQNPASRAILARASRYADARGNVIDRQLGELISLENDEHFWGHDENLPFATRAILDGETIEFTFAIINNGEGKRDGLVLSCQSVTELVAADQRERERATADAQATADLLQKVDKILDVVATAALGDLTRTVPNLGEDAVGRISGGLAQLLSDLRSSLAALQKNTNCLEESAQTLSAISTRMSNEAKETSSQADSVAQVSSSISAAVQRVASATARLDRQVHEVGDRSEHASRVAEDAVKRAEAASAIIGRLDTASREIGAIVKTIHDIAQQTNLLALNATIESARAGEAGRGFAVVANEVKDLAKSTAGSTDDIRRRIEAIQKETNAAIEAISEVRKVIVEICSMQSDIATSVREQVSATQAITRELTQAADGSNQISENISRVAETARHTNDDASATQHAAAALSQVAEDIAQLVQRFRV